jgi:hypothetical protein
MRAAALSVLLLGCGTPNGEISLELRQYDPVALTQAPIGDGKLDLMLPPQGGFVVFLGAELRNVNEGSVELRGRILDRGTVIAEDIRNVPVVDSPAAGDLKVPDLRSYLNVANIAVCPYAGSDDRVDHSFTVDVRVRELSSGRSGSGSRELVLTCRQSDPRVLALCKCQCEGDFILGKCTV